MSESPGYPPLETFGRADPRNRNGDRKHPLPHNGFDLPESGDPVGRSARERLVWVAARTSAPLITEDVELAPRENTVF